MQLLYVANRYEQRPRRSSALARSRDRRRLRPVSGVEHRVRRSAGTRPAVADRRPAVSAAAGSDDPARHRAGDCGAAQGDGARSVRARSRAALARARQLPASGGADGWLRLDGERPRDAVSSDVLSAVATRSRRRKRADFAGARRPAASARARVQRRARRADIVNQHHHRVLRTAARRRTANASRTFAWRCAAGRSVCDGVGSPPAQRVQHRKPQVARELARLVEATRHASCERCSGTGTTSVRALQHVAAVTLDAAPPAAARAIGACRTSSACTIVAQRAFVRADRARQRDEARMPAAPRATAAVGADRPPGRKRDHRNLAERRGDRNDGDQQAAQTGAAGRSPSGQRHAAHDRRQETEKRVRDARTRVAAKSGGTLNGLAGSSLISMRSASPHSRSSE